MTTTERILFVDDDSLVLDAFARLTRRYGIEADLAASAEEAVRMCCEQEYAVVATDYRMPNVDGLELVDQLRTSCPDTTFMLVSGECDLDLAVEAVNERGLDYVVPKPWDNHELDSLLRRGIELHWERAARTRLQELVPHVRSDLEIEKARVAETLLKSEALMADMLLSALKLRHEETETHCRRVVAYSAVLADEMNLGESALFALRRGALLHDVGKIGIPDQILLKMGDLDEEEWELMRQHPVMGAEILSKFEFLKEARQVVLQHHERWDGQGYPFGLKEESISIEARIFAVVDAFDAIVSQRPYKDAKSFEEAIELIKESAGTQFDPAVVKAFVGVDIHVWETIRRHYSEETEQQLAA